MGAFEKIIREIVSKRDPFGYYVVVALNSSEAEEVINKYKVRGELLIEEVGNVIIVRSKSRKIVEELTRVLVTKKLIAP